MQRFTMRSRTTPTLIASKAEVAAIERKARRQREEHEASLAHDDPQRSARLRQLFADRGIRTAATLGSVNDVRSILARQTAYSIEETKRGTARNR